MKFINLISVLIFLILYSCKSNGYSYEQKRFHFFKSSYSKNDSLLIADFILYGISEESHGIYRQVQLDEDSLFNIFKYSVSILEAPVHFAYEHTNKVNGNTYNNKYLRYKEIDKTYIFEIANKHKENTVIVPIIQKYFKQRKNVGPSGADTYPHYICLLSLAVFIVKNDEIIYYKQMKYGEHVKSEYHSYAYHDFRIPISQKHWDGLVREVMKEYIERLE